MGLNLSTNPTFTGRITAPSLDYPQGSSQNETSAGANDGTPYNKQRADDVFGFQQALMNAVQTPPTGNADTALVSDYLQAINALAAGRANTYDDTGAANAYVMSLRAGQQKVHSLFDGFTAVFLSSNPNTPGASTIDVSACLGQAPGTTVKPLTLGGLQIPSPLMIGVIIAVYDLSNDRFDIFNEAIVFSGGGATVVDGSSGLTWMTQDVASASATVGGSGWWRPDWGSVTWQDVTGSRASGVTYTNTNDYPIVVKASNTGTAGGNINAVVGGVNVEAVGPFAGQSGRLSTTFIVPPGGAYRIDFVTSPLQIWTELR